MKLMPLLVAAAIFPGMTPDRITPGFKMEVCRADDSPAKSSRLAAERENEPALAAPQDQKAEASAKMTELLTESGYTFKKFNETTWTLNMNGLNVKNPRVLAVVTTEMALIAIIVAEKNDLKPTEDLYRKLLKLNHRFDYVKALLDKDDDLVVRIDMTLRILDVKEFKACCEQLKATANEVRTEIKPFLKN